MKLVKVVINNFMSVQEATLYLSDKGLVSIEGVNKDGVGADSNGAGKSTIINAILWCLYGEAGKNIKADSVVNKKYKKDCFVETTLQEGDRIHRVTRYRKHKTGKNSTKVELFNDPLWMEITKAGSTNVQQQINELLGQDYLTFQASCFAQQDEALDIPAMTDTKLKELLEKVLPTEGLNEKFVLATMNVANKKKEISEINSTLTFTNMQIAEYKRLGLDAVKRRNNYAFEILEKNSRVDALITGKQQAIDTAKLLLTDVSKLDAEIGELTKAIDACGDTNIGAATAIFSMKIKLLDKAKNDYEKLDNQCPTCGSEQESKEALQKRLLPDVQRLEKEYQEAKENVRKVSDNLTKAAALEELKEELYDKRLKHVNAERTIKALEADIKGLEGHRVSVGENPHKATVEGLGADLRATLKHRETLTDDLAELDKELELLEAVQFTFSPKGVRYHMLEKVAPQLTQLTNKYLKILTDNAIAATWSTVVKVGKDYKEKFKIDTYVNSEETEYGALSGGEKRKVRLACFFALQDLIASKATKNISIWCGDEIDHALDPAGIERLMVILDAKTKTKGTILVISHNELRHWIPNSAVVTRKDDVSLITGYLNDR